MTLMIEAPSPNFDAAHPVPGHHRAALHRHGDRRGGARRGCATRRPRSRPTTSSRRTAASSAWCPRSGAPGTPGVSFWRGEAQLNARLDRHRDRQSRPRVRLPAVPGRPDRRGDRPAGRHPHALEHRRTPASSAIPTSRPARKVDPGELFPGSAWPRPATACGPRPPPSPGEPLGRGRGGRRRLRPAGRPDPPGLRPRPVRPVRRHDHQRGGRRLPAALACQSRFDGVADGETRAPPDGGDAGRGVGLDPPRAAA